MAFKEFRVLDKGIEMQLRSGKLMSSDGEDGDNLIEDPELGSVRAYFNFYWLRDNCPTSFDKSTRERSFDIFQLSQAPVPEDVTISDDYLTIKWLNEDHTSQYSFQMLRDYSAPKKRHDPVDELKPKLWLSDNFANIKRYSLDELTKDNVELLEFVRAIFVDGAVIVNGMLENDLDNLVELLGHKTPCIFGTTFDVNLKQDPSNTAYTSGALELHTDMPAMENPPDVQFLHFMKNSTTGGTSLMADGISVAKQFQQQDPHGFKMLSETEIPYFCDHDDFDIRSKHTVIKLDSQGEVKGLSVSQHMLDKLDIDQKVLDLYYPALCRFGVMLRDEKFLMRYKMAAGECMVFDNHRMVHGRDAYVGESGERHLRGTYISYCELKSKYRSLNASILNSKCS